VFFVVVSLSTLKTVEKKSAKEVSTEQHLEMNSNPMDYVVVVPSQVILFYAQYCALICRTQQRIIYRVLQAKYQVIFSQEYYEIHIISCVLISTNQTPASNRET